MISFNLILMLLVSIKTVECADDQIEARKLSINSKIHIFLLKLMGKYELLTTEPEINSTTTLPTTTTQPTTTTTRKPRKTKTTTTITPLSTTTDLPYVVAENRMRFVPGRGLVNERVPVVDWENKMYLSWIKQGKIDELPIGLYKLYTTTMRTTTTPRILTDSDYYSDSRESN
ncbi:hypothetical protein ACKWTF_016404 [Chironomus riparius]